MGIWGRRARQLVEAQSDGRDHQADERGRVLGEYRPKRRVARGHDRADQVPSSNSAVGRACRTQRKNDIPFEHERNREHDIPDDEIARCGGMQELLYAMGHREPRPRPRTGQAPRTATRRRPLGHGREDARGRPARRTDGSAISRNTSLPVSAQECAASASIDADPVTSAATDFATAMRRFAPNAMRTVVRLPEPPPLAEPESLPRNGSDFAAGLPSVGGMFPKHRRRPQVMRR